MNLLYALIYLIQLAIYVCLLILFRVYLFLIFLTKDGARWVSAILLTIAGLVLREPARAILHPALSRVTDPLLARLSQDHPALELYALIAPWRYELILLLVIYLAMILVRWTGHLIRPILAALPMPARPLPPILRRVPPRHIIRAVRCYPAVPALPLRYYGGDRRILARALTPALQALLTAPAILPAPEDRERTSLGAPPEPEVEEEGAIAPKAA